MSQQSNRGGLHQWNSLAQSDWPHLRIDTKCNVKWKHEMRGNFHKWSWRSEGNTLYWTTPGVRACVCVCVCLACVKGVDLYRNSEREQHSLFGCVKTSRLSHTSVPFAHALPDAPRTMRILTEACLCVHVARATSRAASNRLGLS